MEMSIEAILSKEVFEKALNVLGIQENENADLSKTAMSRFLKGSIEEQKTDAKNVILINSIHSLGLTYVPPISVRNQCPSCNGNGFKMIFIASEEIKCPSCNGTGWKISQCTKCSGTGKIGESPCFICHGRGTYIYKKTDKYPGKKCLQCSGIGKIKKLIQSDTKIQEVSFCKRCNATGIFSELQVPLISSESAKKLNKLKVKGSNNNNDIPEPVSLIVAAPVEKEKKEKKEKKSKKVEKKNEPEVLVPANIGAS